jgi:hypothetical protein
VLCALTGGFSRCALCSDKSYPRFSRCALCFVGVCLESVPGASMNLWNRKWRITEVSFGTSAPLGGGGRGGPKSGDVDLDARRRANPLFEVLTNSDENSGVRHRVDDAVSIACAKLAPR